MKREELIHEIADIINDVVDIEEGPYGWAGPTVILTNKDKCAEEILDYLGRQKEKEQ